MIIKNGFYAYGSKPTHCGEFIEEAIIKINKSGHLVNIKSWKQLAIGGNLLISTILREIEYSDFVCADITGINENVMFELGFAIGRRKPVWITQDISISETYSLFKQLNFLTNVGYINYTSSQNIVDSFIREKAYQKTEELIDMLITDIYEPPERTSLFYLKSQHDTNYNQYIVDEINHYDISVIIDDAVEAKTQPLSWYVSHLLKIPYLLVEYSSTYRVGHEIQNAKCAFVAGLALGLGIEVQMIAEKPFPEAIDYQEYLKKFTNLDLCKAAINPFLLNIKNNPARLLPTRPRAKYSKRKESQLQRIKFGEFIAEHESLNIYEYYVNTTHDENLIKSEYNIVVGRKGSGKTATLYYLQTSLENDIRNEVVTIKPVNFEIDGLIELLKKLNSDFEKGYIIQSIWKFLIYSEIAKQIYNKVSEKKIHALDETDKRIISFVEANKRIIFSDFSTRLEQEFINLDKIVDESDQTKFQEKIAEVLHEKVIKELKELIVSYMLRRKRLVVLIDNLDKNWRKGSNTEVISKFILGLLSVIGRMARELKGSPKKQNDFTLNLIVFLRSDIFKHVLLVAREPDKIEYTRLRWNDPEILFRVLDKRLEYLSNNGESISEVFWEKYICERVDGHDVQDFILSCIIPRPRDLIFFIASAKASAVSRGHDRIEENDLKAAYEDYSNWVFQSILVENGITIEQLKKFMYHLMGENSIMTRESIEQIISSSEIKISDLGIDYFIGHLCSLSFLGREIRKSEFSYEYDFEVDEKILALAAKLNSNRFKIHNAFIPYLECSDYIK